MLNDRDDLARYIHQRLQWSMEVRPENVTGAAAQSAPAIKQAEAGDDRALQPLLSCPEERFADLATFAVLRRSPTVTEVVDICERRGQGVPRARILRDLLRKGADEGLEPPRDWHVVLPRHINVAPLLSNALSRERFVAAAYETILRRTPSDAEIRLHVGALRWRTRSDVLAAMARSGEAAAREGEIILEGLGRRSPSLLRFLRQIAGRRHQPGSAERAGIEAAVKEIRQLIQNLNERLDEAVHDSGMSRRTLQSLIASVDAIRSLADHRLGELARDAAEERRAVVSLGNAIDSVRNLAVERFSELARHAAEGREILQLLPGGADSARAEYREHLSSVLAAVDSLHGALVAYAAMSEKQDAVLSQIAEVRTAAMNAPAEFAGLRQEIGSIGQPQIAALERVASRMRPPAIPAPGVTVVEVDGFLMGVPAAEWRSSSYYHHRGPMEPGVYALLKKRIRPGMLVADVGANIGLYTLLSSRLLQGSGRVFSFEPTPSIFPILRNNVQLNGSLEPGVVRLYNAAVTDRMGRAEFYGLPEDSTHNSLYPESETAQRVEVETVTLDEILGPESRLDFVKIDIEGAEPLAIRGMRRILQNNPQIVIVMEFALEHLRRGGHDPAAFLEELTRLGLRSSIIDDISGELLPATPSVVLGRPGSNLFLTH